MKTFCFQNGYPINLSENDGRVLLHENNQKLIFNFSKSGDEGYYECKVSNKIGITISNYTLSIKGKQVNEILS